MDADSSGVYGFAPEQWEQALDRALESHDHRLLRLTLGALRSEIGDQAETVMGHASAPHVDRLVEQARRLLSSEPTAMQSLEDELDRERRVWAGFRERYRQVFVPERLHPFLESCGLFLRPVDGGAQFRGFAKYVATSEEEAITLYLDDGEGTPPNFFSAYDANRGRFVVLRAYRTSLPRGAGKSCILEHLEQLAPSPGDLRELVYDNVQNRATYRAHVEQVGGARRLRDGVGTDDTPLGRLTGRILADRGQRVTDVRPVLDGFGFLDLGFVAG